MNEKSYLVPTQLWQIEQEVKRSKFLSLANNASTRDEASDFIRTLRHQHPQANHVCWAYIAGSPDTTVRSMSDDGEPSGTAGMPMLKVLEHSGYGDIVVAVVRYFGGVKLGTGGLQRAYSDAVSKLLESLPVHLKVSRAKLVLHYEYVHEAIISRLLMRFDVSDLVPTYAEQVSLHLAVAQSDYEALKAELINLTAGDIKILLSE